MSKIGIYDFLDFEYHYLEFIKRTLAFPYINSSNFLILDSDNKSINYQYKHATYYEYNIQEVNQIINSDSWIETIEDVAYFSYPQADNHFTKLHIRVKNPIDNRKTLAVLILDMDPSYQMSNFKSTFNSHYFQQLCYHVETVCTNYEKLYYLIDIFSELLTAKDAFMPFHMTNVANLALKLSLELNINEKDRMILYIAALLHDVGKLFVPDSILSKPEKLTDDEFERIKSHSQKGSEILSAIIRGMTLLKQVPQVIKHHHEDYDGSGYPAGLTGRNIPYLSRILRVADATDTMLSRRAYKSEFSLDRVMEELKDNAGLQFDPKVSNVAIKILSDKVDDLYKTDILNESFIPFIAFSFYYMKEETLTTLHGNLVINDENVTFIRHDSDKKFYSIQSMNRASISYFSREEFLEYFVDISEGDKDRFIFKALKKIPTDKMFSMIWKGSIQINIGKDNKILGEYVKLGGNTIVFELTDKQHNQIQKSLHLEISVLIDETIEEVVFQKLTPISIIKLYKAVNGWIYVAKLNNLTPAERDKLLRLLFRMQILQRKSNTPLNKDS